MNNVALRFDLHLLGWHSFEQLCRTICRVVFDQTIEAYSLGADGGRDGFLGGHFAHGQSHGQIILQCKHTTKPGVALADQDLNPEVPKIRHHVEKGECDAYLIMTNYKVSGGTEASIRSSFLDIGVGDVRVLGYEAITELLTDRKELRASVPRIYGLGDLSEILDERAYGQAELILAMMHDDLARLVPVATHESALIALRKHRFVLLLGRPGSGKTCISASLALGAVDLNEARAIKLKRLGELETHWNPHDSKQLFWIDDAFGATQFDHASAEEWNRNLQAIEAIRLGGGQILMTSRDYVFEAARPSLKRGSTPLSEETEVVIEVEGFTNLEKQQILYNHLRLGKQPQSFLDQLVPADLEAVCDRPDFLPEIARRLGNPTFTSHMRYGPNEYQLNDFFARPREFLLEVLVNLDSASRGAIGLIYQRGGVLDSPYVSTVEDADFLARIGTNASAVTKALPTLDGSLLRLTFAEGRRWWQFHHPTLLDAYSSWLANDPELLTEYIKHAPLDELLRTVTCGEMGVENTLIVPVALYPIVNTRLEVVHDEVPGRDRWRLQNQRMSFLANRCDDRFVRDCIARTPSILEEAFDIGAMVDAYQAQRDLAFRLLKLGLAPELFRSNLVEELTYLALAAIDASFLADPKWMEFFSPAELTELDNQFIGRVAPRLADIITERVEELPEHMTRNEIDATLDGYSARYGELPTIKKARRKLDDELMRRRLSYDDDDDWTSYSGTDGNAVTQRSIFDDLADSSAMSD